jgi:hypothetical protein
MWKPKRKNQNLTKTVWLNIFCCDFIFCYVLCLLGLSDKYFCDRHKRGEVNCWKTFTSLSVLASPEFLLSLHVTSFLSCSPVLINLPLRHFPFTFVMKTLFAIFSPFLKCVHAILFCYLFIYLPSSFTLSCFFALFLSFRFSFYAFLKLSLLLLVSIGP